MFEKPPIENTQEGNRGKEVIAKLDSLDLSMNAIAELSANEIYDLHEQIADLHHQIPEEESVSYEGGSRLSSEAMEIMTKSDKDVLQYVSSLDPEAKDIFDALLQDTKLEPIVASKFREYAKEHVDEAMTEVLETGKTPFGDQTDVLINFYKKRGIDIINPTEADKEAFVARQNYSDGSIGNELHRRFKNRFASVDTQTLIDIREIFYNLLRDPNEKNEVTTLHEGNLATRLAEIEEGLIDKNL